MAENRDTLELIAEQLLLAIEPLVNGFSHPDAAKTLLEEMGWDFSSVPAALDSLQAPVQQAYDLVNTDSLPAQDTVQQIIQSVKEAFTTIENMKSQGGLPSDFKNEFPTQLVQYLLVEYLVNYQPSTGYLLSTIGIIKMTEVAASGSRLAYTKKEFAFSAFGDFFDDPLVFFKDAYNWGASEFKENELLHNIYGLMNAWGLGSYEEALGLDTVNQLIHGALHPENAFGTALKVVFFESSVSPIDFNAGFKLFILPETASDKPGFAVLPFATGAIEESFKITDHLELGIEGGLDLTGGLGVIIRPSRGIELLTGFGSGTPSSLSGHILFSLALSNPEEPFLLIGKRDASRMELAGVSTKLGSRLSATENFEIMTEFALKDGKIVVKPDPEETDGFLSKILPADGITLNFDLGVGFSSEQGFYFSGSTGLEIVLPVHIDLGILKIEGALISLSPKIGSGTEPFRIDLDMATTFKTDFGALKAVVENIGLRTKFIFPDDNSGNLGPVDLSLGLRPPNGVGLAINAGVIKGGGYLYLDFDRGEYAGALELVFSEWIALKAIGLINTKMPDGSDGFSMVIIVTAEFGSGIQLGFGFTLLGVGGILGLHRMVNVEPLRVGVRTGAVESVMFPQDVIANAPRIISDLRAFFPIKQDAFLVGPMAKIGYGTPTLVSISIGVIIEFPDVAITILGVLKVVLPDENAEVLKLQVNFIGRIEPANSQLWFYAELFDSKILWITLEGGMGLLVNWGENANFVFSIGGFHPKFNPPPLPFDEPPRLAVNILDESMAKIRVECYFAVTSNTVQFGARVELFFGFSALSLEGHLGFDALFQFDPFYFSFEFSAGLSVKVFGFGLFSISISGMLEGPTKWHIKGKAKWKITFLGPTIKIDVDHTWGEDKQTELPPIEIFPLIEKEFDAITNWVAVLPKGKSITVCLRKLDQADTSPSEQPDTNTLVLHPVGKLRISQRKLPLKLKLDKLGNQKPSDVNKLAVSVQVGGGDTMAIIDVKEKFAEGEFKQLDESQKLGSPGFEDYDGGIELTSQGEETKTSMAVKRVIRYETVIIDSNYKRHVYRFFDTILQRFSVLNRRLFSHFLRGNNVTHSKLSASYRNRIQPNKQHIEIQPNLYTVAYKKDNRSVSVETTSFSSKASAMDYLETQRKQNPGAANQMHVIPNIEVNIAA